MLFKDKEIMFDSPKIMGILNVTPDSFSDGGKFATLDKALSQVHNMITQGATFIDVGGESTRPGAKEISGDEELNRVMPVIEALNNEFNTIISIDTSKAEVMAGAVQAGASMINDVRALQLPNAVETAAKFAKEQNIPTCIMHMQGSPKNMQNSPIYSSVVNEVMIFFQAQINRLEKAGFQLSQIILDPGFGFGKTLDHNYQLLKNLHQLTQFELPILAGMSRKSMIGNIVGKDIGNRLYGDIAATTIAAMHGASILRVHDVEQTMDAIKIVNKINSVK